MAFGVLFDLRLSHDFWLNFGTDRHEVLPDATQDRLRRAAPVQSYLRLRPTPETRHLMAGRGIVFKPRDTGALVGIELTDNTNQPRRPMQAGDVLRFALTLRDAAFVDYTADVLPRFSLFSNSSGNARGGELHLSRAVAAHQAARAYLAGDLRAVQQGPVTQLFQARRDTGPSANPVAADWARVPGDTHDATHAYVAGDRVLSGDHLFQALVDGPGANLGNAAQWADLGPIANQYATQADHIVLRGPVFATDVSALNATRLDIRVRLADGGAEARRHSFEDPLGLTTLGADLRGLSEGRYRFDIHDAQGAAIAGQGYDFFLSAQAVSEGWFGVVEIAPVAGTHAMTDNAGNLVSPRYELRFANIQARRQFRFPLPQAQGQGAEVAPDQADARVLVAQALRPVSSADRGLLLRADDPNTPGAVETLRLPHAPRPSLSKLNGEWVSTTHLSNFPPLN